MKSCNLHQLNNFIIVLIFGAAIFTPFYIGIFEKDRSVSRVERRNLSQLPEIPKTIEDIQRFPRLFDNYYKDHFGLRDFFTKYYKLIKYSIGDSPSEDVTIGKNGWLFLGSIKKGYNGYYDPMGDFRNVNIYSQHELKKVSDHMAGLNAWLNSKGIKYLFVIAPNKHTIYFDQLPNYITKVRGRSSADQLIEYLKKHTDIPVVDLRHRLMNAKEKHQLYYKTDTHWNHYAANIAQYEIMAEIEKLFPKQIHPEMKALRHGMRRGGDLARFIGIHADLDYDPQPRFEQTCVPVTHPPGARGRTPHTLICEGQKLNAIVFRDSFFTALQPYFSRKFKRSTYITERLSYSTLIKYMELEKPDIIIEEWVERALPFVPKSNYEFLRCLPKSNSS